MYGLGAAAVQAARSLTEVASTAAGFLTSVFIRVPFMGALLLQDGDDEGGPLDTFIDAVKSIAEFLAFLREEGWDIFKEPTKLITFWFKGDVAAAADAFLGKLVDEPKNLYLVLYVVFSLVALAGTFWLFMKVNSYISRVALLSYDHTPEQIFSGAAGVTSPYYYGGRIVVSLGVMVAAPIFFVFAWVTMHDIFIAEFLRVAYAGTTVGTEAAEVILSLAEGKTLVWMWITLPAWVGFIQIFLVTYVLLHLAVIFAWAWHIWRTAWYGDGDSTVKVITDTGLWAWGLLAVLALEKILLLLTPGMVNVLNDLVDLSTAFSAWLVFLIVFPWATILVAKLTGKPLSALARNITVRHVMEPSPYTSTSAVVSSTTRQAVGGLRDTWSRGSRVIVQGYRSARRLRGGVG
jgi:hypothetical protein